MSITSADRIKEIRTQLGLSMHKFSRKVGLAVSTVSCYESGRRSPSVESCYMIINFARMNGINVTIEWLRPEY